MEEPVFTGKGNEIRFRDEYREPEGGIDFEIGAFDKKRANCLQQSRSLLQALGCEHPGYSLTRVM
jgi:hypothetical protein